MNMAGLLLFHHHSKSCGVRHGSVHAYMCMHRHMHARASTFDVHIDIRKNVRYNHVQLVLFLLYMYMYSHFSLLYLQSVTETYANNHLQRHTPCS